MRLGLITLPLHSNYGGIVQCYALKTVLEQFGHDIIIIEFPRKKPFKNLILGLLKRCILLISPKNRNQMQANYLIMSFVEKHIKRERIMNPSKIRNYYFDGFIVGSDQVWRPDFIRDRGRGLYNYFLDFSIGWNVKRIAYAASFGKDEWTFTEKETKACEKLIKSFNGVSVREYSGIELCEKYFNYKEAIQLVDPTLLLEKDNYLQLINKEKEDNKQLFSYILDPSFESAELEKVAMEKTGFLLCRFYNDGANSLPSVESWLAAFRDSKMIITDSFHGCVFSIIFNKPFWVIKNDAGGNTRIDSLLRLFEMETRFVTPMELRQRDIFECINWDKINSIKKSQKQKALNFINNTL